MGDAVFILMIAALRRAGRLVDIGEVDCPIRQWLM